jgi:hypothetical protein
MTLVGKVTLYATRCRLTHYASSRSQQLPNCLQPISTGPVTRSCAWPSLANLRRQADRIPRTIPAALLTSVRQIRGDEDRPAVDSLLLARIPGSVFP